MSNAEDNALTDVIKQSVIGSGALANLKDVSYNVAPHSHDDTIKSLKQEAQTAIQAIKQLLDGLNPDIGISQKLKAALLDLRTALASGTISRAALETALGEADTALNGANSNEQSPTAQEIEAKLWQRVEADNKDIDDDFEKMGKAGIMFGDKLWNRHKQLTEYLQNHPHDIACQKKLDAVDDALLIQAETQLGQYPDAKTSFDDATSKSKDRHQAVDKALADVSKTEVITNSAFDDDTHPSIKEHTAKLTMDDVIGPVIGHKPKPTDKQYT